MAIHHIRPEGPRADRRRPRRVFAAPLGVAVATIAAFGMLVVPSAPPAGAATAPAQGFTTQEAPLPADAGNGSTDPHVYTASSTCAAQNSCVVVGWYDDTNARPWGLIETQNGTSWSVTEAPEPSNAGTGTNQGMWIGSQGCGITAPCHAVSCAGGVCLAVGNYLDNAGHSRPVVEIGSGTTWTPFQAPVPSDAQTSPPSAYLRSVTCVSSTECWAVGGYTTTSGDTSPLIVLYDGSSLTGETASPPADISTTSPGMFPSNVSCSSATSCTAVGQYNSTTGTKGVLISTAGGPTGTWSAMAAPEPADAAGGSSVFAQLFDVACTSEGCTAVGQYRATNGFPAFVVTGSGTTWTAVAAPLPSNAATGSSTNASLLAVSCGSRWMCAAVGSYHDGSNRPRALIDQYDDSLGSWVATEGPQPADAASETGQDAQLQSVSCPSALFCMTVGLYVTQAGIGSPLLDTFSGGSWSGMRAPLPSNFSPSPTLAAYARVVACYSVVSCVLGGWYPDPGLQQGFLDTFSGLQGYWLVASDGGIFSYGNAQFYGSAGSLVLNAPVVGMASSPTRHGYWSVASDGGIFNYGDAGFFGSAGSLRLNKPVVGMAATPDGKGYWLVASDGGIFSYGDAAFFGSRGGQPLNKPIVGMAATPDGLGYWLVASDGGIFSYGDAGFFGSAGSLPLNKPVVGMASTSTGQGYWLVATDGGVFTYGDAGFFGSAGSLVLNKPVVGMAPSPSGQGYWLDASDGGIFTYGDAVFYGSAGSLALNKPVVGMADG